MTTWSPCSVVWSVHQLRKRQNREKAAIIIHMNQGTVLFCKAGWCFNYGLLFNLIFDVTRPCLFNLFKLIPIFHQMFMLDKQINQSVQSVTSSHYVKYNIEIYAFRSNV